MSDHEPEYHGGTAIPITLRLYNSTILLMISSQKGGAHAPLGD
jgi:hypothetical protein